MSMKNELRKEMLKKRSAMPEYERDEKSRIIKEKLISLDKWKKAERVFTYVNMGSEVNTTELIKQAWNENKKVFVPIAKKDRLMYFVEILSFDGMKRSSLGVMEPEEDIEKEVKPKKDDLVIVPGSMFDLSKNRCGYGGGYYDTYGEKYQLEKTVGICFDFQLLDNIPTEKYDRKLNMIITEKRTVN
jgi:5-formyltetrahydrofolate cyclo-ligase